MFKLLTSVLLLSYVAISHVNVADAAAGVCNNFIGTQCNQAKDIVFLLDISGSMSASYTKATCKLIIQQAACALTNPNSRFSLVIYGSALETVIPLTDAETFMSEVPRNWGAIQSSRGYGYTPLVEGLDLAEGLLTSISTNQKQIVVITDGPPNPMKRVSEGPYAVTPVYDAQDPKLGMSCGAQGEYSLPLFDGCKRTTNAEYLFSKVYNQVEKLEFKGIILSAYFVYNFQGTAPNVNQWLGIPLVPLICGYKDRDGAIIQDGMYCVKYDEGPCDCTFLPRPIISSAGGVADPNRYRISANSGSWRNHVGEISELVCNT